MAAYHSTTLKAWVHCGSEAFGDLEAVVLPRTGLD